jgi:hypothetical protein
MKNRTIGFFVATMTCAFAAAVQAAPECRSETAYVPRIDELVQPLPPERALPLVVGIKPDTALFHTLRAAPPSSYGAILNDIAPASITFDPRNARKLTDSDSMPLIYVYGCLRDGASLVRAMDDLKKVPGIYAVAPDTLLEEIPPIPSAPAQPRL